MYLVREWRKVKCFLNLEKYRATQGCLQRIIENKKKLNDSQQINDALYNFYQTLFKKNYPYWKNAYRVFLIKCLSLN